MTEPEKKQAEQLEKQAGRTKTDLVRKLLERLNASPDRVRFPRADPR